MFRKNKISLTITVDDGQDTESTEDQFNTEMETLIKSFYKTDELNEAQFDSNDRQNLLAKKNTYLEQLLDHMEGENYINDISYKKRKINLQKSGNSLLLFPVSSWRRTDSQPADFLICYDTFHAPFHASAL